MCFICLYSLAGVGFGQVSTFVGRVEANGQPLAFATVAVENTTLGASSDETGYFELTAVGGQPQQLVISAIGYKSFRQDLKVDSREVIDLGIIRLQEDVLGLEEVVVTGTMKETFIAASPIKVDIITAKYFEKRTAPTNLMEAVTLVNGVQEVVACGVCFTNSISINGLPGPYTAVLMDGTPMYGNLASVYGLNGIPTMIIDRFEVIKGPNSTLYGSEAMAGVINIITKDPAKQPILAADIMGTSHGESFGNLALAPKIGKYKGYIGLNYAYINEFEDSNGDGFGDNIGLDRVSLFSKWTKPGKGSLPMASFAVKYYYEDRRNGVKDFFDDRAYRTLRGSDQVYGESIYTNRIELFGTQHFKNLANLKLDYSASHHLQNSYYGSNFYEAAQSIGFANLTWQESRKHHDLLFGWTARLQRYDDNTVATPIVDEQFIPGIFVQDEWLISSVWTLLGGLRLDHYNRHGFIFAPRLAAKWKPSTWTTLRANFGTGFRVVNLFTEDHAFVTGQREVEIEEALQPERSYNGSLNFNQIYTFGKSQGSLDVDGFYTYFTNKIIPNYDEPQKIIYANTQGHAISKGVGISINHHFAFPLSLNLGINYQQVEEVSIDANGRKRVNPLAYAPKWSGVGSANYEWQKTKLTLAYTVRYTGEMALPEVFDLDDTGNPLSVARPIVSMPFSFHNFQVTKAFRKNTWQLYAGLQNILNYRQPISPLVGYNDPNAAIGFSPFFDTAYAYSPLHGRELYVGVRWRG